MIVVVFDLCGVFIMDDSIVGFVRCWEWFVWVGFVVVFYQTGTAGDRIGPNGV